MADTLYVQLGGYDGIAAVAGDLLPRLQQDVRLGHFWPHRGTDGLRREKRLLIDYLCSCAGGRPLYTARDMKTAHVGMRTDEGDWQPFTGHTAATLEAFKVPAEERATVLGFAESLKGDIVA